MLLMAFAYFLYLYIDIRLYVYRARHELKQRMERKRLIEEHIVQFIVCYHFFCVTRIQKSIYTLKW